MKPSEFNQQLCRFLNQSPTPFHATGQLRQALVKAGYTELDEGEAWDLGQGGRYFVVRNESSLIAFQYADSASLLERGIHMVGAHTDSPCLKVKPAPEINNQGYQQLGVEVYGGALLNPWFDRDLSLAGRVGYKNTEGKVCQTLIDFKAAIGSIPNLAIHLDREANSNRSVNSQLHLPVILGQGEKFELRSWLKDKLQAEGCDVASILDFELSFYDTQPAAVIGLRQQFIASARLDNLLSCFVGLQALLDSDYEQPAMLICNDHEEVGSLSAAGADGPFLESVLMRLLPEADNRARVFAKSLLVSADNAHGIHPNYADKHDSNHGPLLNAGPVIKINANQRYATNSETSSIFRHFAEIEKVAVQVFTIRTDLACGSTIGPITAGKIGVNTIDVGVPTFAMHSIRELAGSEDAISLYKVLRRFQSEKP